MNNWRPHSLFHCLTCLTAILFCSGCASVIEKETKLSWRGFYVGTQVVTPYTAAPTKESVSVYGTAIIGLGERNSLQLQVSEPVTAWDKPVLRIAIDRKIF